MKQIRVLHVPSHLPYVRKLDSEAFTGVTHPAGRPVRITELLVTPDWDFFDVVHLHTVELCSRDELRALTNRLARLKKALVVTVHDLVPNIETDRAEYARKLDYIVERADGVLTLTRSVARTLPVAARTAPHGAAISTDLIPDTSLAGDGGLAVYGAPRTYRDWSAVLRAWRRLPAPRPGLRFLLRSVDEADRTRYSAQIADLGTAAAAHPKVSLDITEHLVTETDLIAWLTGATALILPYHAITHSGQLELAQDLGIPVLAPDLPTLHEQVDRVSPTHPVVWFGQDELNTETFTDRLEQATKLPPAAPAIQALRRAHRLGEHDDILTAHRLIYRQALQHGK
jgi:glycosyltransferase involved in cell wall biosynthesis